MNDRKQVPLVLGGHSFFSNLGNEPAPDAATRREIVSACLDSGITIFDTTHQPERLALGQALTELGRRDEATILAWNFMKVLQPEDKLDRPVEYQPHHLEQLCGELQTDYIDGLVLHDLDGGTSEEHRRQEELAETWVKQGHAKTLGIWDPKENARQRYGGKSSYTFMVRPYNVRSQNVAPIFALCKELGWQNYACSPFVRGWELDKLVTKVLARDGGIESVVRGKLAELLLRFSLYQPNVDRVITAIRRVAWVRANVENCAHGPLTPEERAWLDTLLEEDRKANSV